MLMEVVGEDTDHGGWGRRPRGVREATAFYLVGYMTTSLLVSITT